MNDGGAERLSSHPVSRNPTDAFGLAAVIVLFLAAAAAVNPLRECPVGDDWAYAATVWHFVETGEYRLNEWLSANIPFETAWGGLFCRALGESFRSLRLSTLALVVLGLIAFRNLAQEHGIERRAANVLTLCLASASLLFRMSLSFMTDAPFFSVMTIAILFATRAVRQMTLASWALASFGGAAAILTRQFGAALLPAIAAVWLFDPLRMKRIGRYALGLSGPALAAAWQLNQGWYHSNWAAQFHFVHQRMFFAGGGFLRNLPWRPTVMIEYFAIWLAPLVLLALVALAREASAKRGSGPDGRGPRWSPLVSLLAWCAFFSGAVVYGWKVVGYLYDAEHVPGCHALMPYLGWNYEILHVLGEPVRWAVTGFVVVGAALFARIFAARFFGRDRAPLTPAQCVLDLTMLFLLVLNLSFTQLWDQYLLVYLPYPAIVVGRRLQGLLIDWRRATIGGCVVLLIGSALWTREELAKDEAMWSLAEEVRATGVPPEQIFSDWKWLFFWNFEDEVRRGRVTGRTSYKDLFDDWLPRQREAAEYWVVHDWNPPPGETWLKLAEARYFSVYARRKETFYAVQRVRDVQSRPAATPEMR